MSTEQRINAKLRALVRALRKLKQKRKARR